MLPANLNSLSDINSQFVINLFPTDFNTQQRVHTPHFMF